VTTASTALAQGACSAVVVKGIEIIGSFYGIPKGKCCRSCGRETVSVFGGEDFTMCCCKSCKDQWVETPNKHVSKSSEDE
jgi:hypothetical protein